MTNTIRSACAVITLAIAMTGCGESARPQATGKGNIRSTNAIVSAPEITFRIEERVQALLAYKDGSAVRFDDLPYTLNFDVVLPGDSEFTRIATQPLEVVIDTEYIVSVNGTLAAATVTVWQQPERTWEGNETVFEVSFGHLTDSIGAVDIYFQAPNTVPAAGNARGSIAKGGFVPAMELPAGDYQLILTAAGDPTTIIYTSPTTSPGGAVSLTYVFFDADPTITGPISVRLMRSEGGSVEQPDQNSPPTFRTYHAAFGTGNYDAYINGDTTTAIASNVAFSELSSDADGIVGDNTVTFTDAGNLGGDLLNRTAAAIAGTRHSMFLIGPPGALVSLEATDDRRPEETIGKLRLVHTATNTGDIDLYVMEPGADITNRIPNFVGVPSLAMTVYLRLVAGAYDVFITPTGEKTVIAGPLSGDFTSDGIAELILLDTADPNVFTLTDWDN